MRLVLRGLVAALVVGVSPAFAQMPAPRDPNMPAPNTTIPEKIKPEEPSSTSTTTEGAGNLSKKLEASEGVITPPPGIDPGITTRAPVPNPGTTPVIPPPGEPGGNPQLQPK